MKILFVHNLYQIAGGEDAVFLSEIELLRQKGHEVDVLQQDNASINSVFARIWTLINLIFSYGQYRKIKRHIELTKPDIVHVHNYFPLITPAVFYAAKKMKVPVVHTLHNYRAVCPTAFLLHKDQIQERSLKQSSWWVVKERVYRNSWLGSLALAAMVETHKKIGTWQTKVDCFIALTDFSKAKFVEAGWPQQKIVVKPNFLDDPFVGGSSVRTNENSGGYALYVGRLSPEKGIKVLVEAWNDINLPLKIIGDGPLKDYVSSVSSRQNSRVDYLGLKARPEARELIRNADFLIVPSVWYETFGMVIIEAFAAGTPVVCSKLGSMANMVVDGMTGLHFEAGNAGSLAEKVQCLFDNPEKAREMGENARRVYLSEYTPDKNYEKLIQIYQQVIGESEEG